MRIAAVVAGVVLGYWFVRSRNTARMPDALEEKIHDLQDKFKGLDEVAAAEA